MKTAELTAAKESTFLDKNQFAIDNRITRTVCPVGTPPPVTFSARPLSVLSCSSKLTMQSVIVASPPPAQPPTDYDPFALSPVRAHYLKKYLIQLEFTREIQAITSTTNNSSASTLSYLGPPFSPPPKDGPSLDLPFLRYLFRQYVLTFPFLESAPKDFFPDKVQPFISSLLSRNLNSTSILDDKSVDPAGTAKLVAKAGRSFALFLNY